MSDYDPADDSRKSYDVCIAAMGEKLRSFRREQIGGVSVRIFNPPDDAVTVYGVRKNENSPFVYVGSTSQPLKERLRAHIVSATRHNSWLPFHDWLRNNRDGFDVRVFEVTTLADRERCERSWIKAHKATLLNLTDGGPGMSGHKFAGSAHARRIAGAIADGASFPCQRCGANFYRKASAIRRGQNKFCSRLCSNLRRTEVGNVAP